MPIRKKLPSLNALRVLEAAARHQGFTAAAAELGVTQAAVSRQIAALEAQLEVELFVRRHRAVEPTPACQLLASSLAISFASIAESVEHVRGRPREQVVTIGATLAFSSYWLLPRIVEFRRRYPSAQIRVVSQDARIPLNGGDVDLALRYGLPPFEDGLVLASRADVVFPVCAPGYVGDEDFATGLAAGRYELIEHEVPDRSWTVWADWLRRARMPMPLLRPGLSVKHFAEALQAARAGQGVALGWGLLVQGHLDDGSLVRLGDTVLEAEGRYNLLVPLRRKPHALRDVFVEWLAASLSQ